MNYPAGVSQNQIDLFYGFADGGDTSNPRREQCFLCHRMIQQEDSTRRWFLDEDAVMGEAYCLTFCDSLDSFETQGGWCCSTICWNENVALNEDESIPARPVLFLVKKGAA